MDPIPPPGECNRWSLLQIQNKTHSAISFNPDSGIILILETLRMSLTGNKAEVRGGTRIPCEIPITLTSLDPVHPFSDPCQIVLVNLRGCAARICRSVEIGMSVRLEGLPTVTEVTGRVVNCISLGEHERLWLLGLALDEPSNVWGIQTPPEDWGQ